VPRLQGVFCATASGSGDLACWRRQAHAENRHQNSHTVGTDTEGELYMKKSKVKSTLWDAAEHLKTNEDMAAYLEAAIEDGDPAVISAAVGDIARAKGMSQIARETGLGRESLYKALSPGGNPEFATILKVVRALGLKFHVEAVAH